MLSFFNELIFLYKSAQKPNVVTQVQYYVTLFLPLMKFNKFVNKIFETNVWVKFEDRPSMCYIFEKVMVRGPQRQCSQLSDVQLHIYNLNI